MSDETKPDEPEAPVNWRNVQWEQLCEIMRLMPVTTTRIEMVFTPDKPFGQVTVVTEDWHKSGMAAERNQFLGRHMLVPAGDTSLTDLERMIHQFGETRDQLASLLSAETEADTSD